MIHNWFIEMDAVHIDGWEKQVLVNRSYLRVSIFFCPRCIFQKNKVIPPKKHQCPSSKVCKMNMSNPLTFTKHVFFLGRWFHDDLIPIMRLVYSFSHNRCGKWVCLKGKPYWRYTHFSLNHDKEVYFSFSPLWSNLTNIFQMGWSYEPVVGGRVPYYLPPFSKLFQLGTRPIVSTCLVLEVALW